MHVDGNKWTLKEMGGTEESRGREIFREGLRGRE